LKGTSHQAFVSYEEARRLIPLFEYLSKEGQWKDLRSDARYVLKELKEVRNVSYTPLPGRQIFLTEDQWDMLDDARHSES